MTYSCFSEEPGRCGRCKACARAFIALSYAEIEIPVDFFETDILAWEGWKEYRNQIEGRGMEERRAQQTREVMVKRGIW